MLKSKKKNEREIIKGIKKEHANMLLELPEYYRA